MNEVGSGLLDRVGEKLLEKIPATRCAIVSDSNVAPLFADRVAASLTSREFLPTTIVVPAGENSKSFVQLEQICERMAEAGLDRSSLVVALGGGMIGDLAGFAAAIYHRGIPLVQLPTTLLAMIDSSIGGKSGIDLAQGKNLAGAIRAPLLVLADVDALETLPAREFRQAFAEMIKHAIVRDAAMLPALQNFQRASLAELVRRNIEIKNAIVARDEHDVSGKRAILNFGHTIGHAIEQATNYTRFLHGEAISLGLVAACEISLRRAGLSEQERDQVVAALRHFDLPTTLPPDISAAQILRAVQFDKKFSGGAVRFVLTPKLGSAYLATDITAADIERAIASLY